MALTVTPNLTTISLCEATTGWSGGQGYVSIDGTSPAQGSFCLSDWVDLTTQTVAKYDLGVGGTDMSNGEHIYTWLYATGAVDTKANGGYRLYAEDTSGNWATWYVGGVDSHPAGGWNIFTVDVNATPNESSGTLNTALIRYVGVQFKVLSDAPIKGQTRFNNVFWDAVRYGTGLTVTSLSTDNVSLADIYAVDDGTLLKYGVITRPAGIDAYIINGKITLGDTGTGSIDFLSSGEVAFFPSNDLVSTTFHGFEAVGNATGTTDVDINGSNYTSSGVPFAFDFSGANIDTISIVGNAIKNSSNPTFEAGQTISSNTFDGCGLIYPNTATFSDNVVKNSAETASYALLLPETHNVSGTIYTDNFWAFGVNPATSGATYSEDGGTFNGNTADVYNIHATNAVTINAINGSTISTSATAGGVVTIENAVAIVVTVLDDTTGLPIEDASVMIKREDTKATITSGRTLASGIYSDSINYTADIDYIGWVRQNDLVGTDYDQKDINGTITIAGANITVRLLPI